MDEFWAEPRLATLGTVRPDGSPHLVPVKAMRQDEAFWVLTRRDSVKVRNVLATGRASLAEHTRTTWVSVEGKARIRYDADLLAAARTAYERRHGNPSTWGDCVLVVEVDRVLHGS
nr:pyridoxamine 5'-phosphate oxidase family protein [Nocardioides panaciterrulae]